MLERFEKFIQYEPNTGCWLWDGSQNQYGYGQFGLDWRKRPVACHRYSYELHKGPIPDGMFVCHTCDVRCCVNPDHLFLGTHSDNMADAARKKRIKRREGHHNAKLSESDIAAIRKDCRSQSKIAADYGVSPQHICRIKNKVRWKD